MHHTVWIAVSALVLIGCGKPTPAGKARPGGRDDSPTADLSRDEEAVSKYVLSHEDDPDSVRFGEWGPHSTDPASVGMAPPAPNNPEVLIRLVWRSTSRRGGLERHDGIFGVRDRKVLWVRPNDDGDSWVEEGRKRVARNARP
jgi:hypothetical protein